MVLFFKSSTKSILGVEVAQKMSSENIQKLTWLFSEAVFLEEENIKGWFIGPRKEVITPWSTNAVEIAQNMNIYGISRIEEFIPVENEKSDYDPMLQSLYNELNQEIFKSDIKPAHIQNVDNVEKYNKQEGLALSDKEIDYLHNIEKQIKRKLTDSEIFGFAQINSEHCRHKIFNGKFIIDGKEKDFSLFNLIKKTTKENLHKVISAYTDNVAFLEGPQIEQFAPKDHTKSDFFYLKNIESVISIKAETHNFPTTVEPFNGASTGTGGEIRDRMAGGIGSLPIAGTAVYMTSYPRLEKGRKWEDALPARDWLYQTPEQILIKASNGASDFGNKFGQPLIAGSVLTFEHQENGIKYGYDKAIMLAGGVGYGNKRDSKKERPQKGNKIVVVGGDNYRIGLGGGSVSSVATGRYSSGIELNAVQRANPEMQKRVCNFIRALCEGNNNPIISIHDHGSAGHVNCLSELVENCGGYVDMSKLPIGDPTLSAKEIIANESQERMGLLIQEEHLEHVCKIAERERTPLYVVGETTGDAHFCFIQEDGKRPFDLDINQMFGHSPQTIILDETIESTYQNVNFDKTEILEYLKNVLKLESVSCKDWLTNKVDRSITGKVARQQCQGELQLPLSDVGVVALDYQGIHGIATSLGHAPQAGLANPANGSILSVAEALTNIVWAPLTNSLDSVSLSANWMWPCRSQKGEDARLYNAVQALSDFCCALKINVPTGKDSLSMCQQYPNGEKIISPGTVIVSAVGEVSNIRKVVSPVMVNKGNTIFYYIDFCMDSFNLGGSAFAQSTNKVGQDTPTCKNPEYFRNTFNAIQELIKEDLILAGHDISAGGLITCLLEMCFANIKGGMKINLSTFNETDIIKILFAESPSVIIQIEKDKQNEVTNVLKKYGVNYSEIGTQMEERSILIEKDAESYQFDIDYLRDIWYETSFLLDQKQSMNGCAEARYRNYKKQPIQFTFNKNFTGLLKQYGINPRRYTLSGTKAAIIREKGTNGEREMAYALHLAGFDVKDVMMTDLITGRETLEDVKMIVFCGGFANSDVLGSAKGWAGAFLYNPKAKKALDNFYNRLDTLSLGVCNGCQLMIELKLIKTGTDKPIRMLHNNSCKLESRYLEVSIPANDSVMLGSLSGNKLGVWVAHGEGRFHLPNAEKEYNIVLKYSYKEYPANPNGSDYNAAGICSKDGRHLAIMPHLERAYFPWQCGYYPKERIKDEVTPWIEVFINARKWIESNSRTS